MRERRDLKRDVQGLGQLVQQLEDGAVLLELAAEGGSSDREEAASHVDTLARQVEEFEFRSSMRDPRDPNRAFLSVQAGAGGTESCDWARMLLRMYSRWAEEHEFRVETIDLLANEEAGIKSATVRIVGEWAFGMLKGEIGVHRLVRISPFDASHRRHTSFASVDVMPEEEDRAIEIQEKDLKIDTFRAGGPGGQHVNRTDSAVRLTHLPTGIVISCQNERSQHKNRATAMKILRARLGRLQEEAREEERARVYNEKGEIAWGNQIRSYVLQPYTLVKDHRTGLEIGNAKGVLEGGIDPLLRAFQMRQIRPDQPRTGESSGGRRRGAKR